VSLQSPHRFSFGPFEVESETGELRKNGRRLRLQEKSFQVLLALLEQKGRLVNREVLRQRLWPGDTFVDFDNGLNTAMSKLREALGDPAGQHQYIETVPRRGYRFVAPVSDVGSPPAPQHRELDIKKQYLESGVVVVKLSGKIILGPESQQIEWLIADLIRQEEQWIVFDISDVKQIDSTGLGIVVVCSGRVKSAGGELRVAGARGDVEHTLKMTFVDHIVDVYPTTAAALKDLISNAA